MYSFEFLTTPVSADNPCGPDLDLQGNADFLQFTANADAVLPASYFRFDRLAAELAIQIASMKPLLSATRDLRLLVILAKYQILDRQFDAFVTTICAIEHLMTQHWGDVHPQGEDGDFAFRVNTLEALDDMAQVILPVQHQALFKSKRAGPISFRTSLLAAGKLQPREEETVLDSVNFEGALGDADLQEMVRSRELMASLKAALNAIQVNSRELMDFQGAVKFERFFPLVGEILAFLDQTIAKRDPAAAILAGADKGADGVAAFTGVALSSSPIMSGPITNLDQAAAALAAIGRYFALQEPSSPALLLIRQAQGLVGKSFFDSIRALMPAHASDAMLLLGANPGFNLSVERLGEVAGEFYEAQTEEASAPAADDGWGWGEDSSEDNGAEASDGDETEQAASESSPEAAKVETTPEHSFVTQSRQDAFVLMGAVQQFYMQSEPTSPVPLLLDRARSVGSLDFLSLMRLVMPSHAFKGADE